AVVMNGQPVANFMPEATACPAGMSTVPALTLFDDDLESGSGNWTFGSIVGNPHWTLEPAGIGLNYAHSGQNALFGNDYDETRSYNDQRSDSFAAMNSSVALPGGSTSFLYFHHSFGFEDFGSYTYDGGILEYSINGGGTWNDAKPLFSAGQNYNGTISLASNSPLRGH